MRFWSRRGLVAVAATVTLLAGAAPADASHDLISRVSAGEINGNGDNFNTVRGISDDGSHVIFETNEGIVPGDTDGFEDVYERSGGTTTKVSTGNGAFNAFYDDISADGSRVVISTLEKLTPADTDTSFDLYERAGGVTTLLTAGAINGNGNFPAPFQGASADGSKVFFFTAEPLVATDLDTEFDIYERSGGTTKLVSAGEINGNGNFALAFRGASEDGSVVYFDTTEQLVPADNDTSYDAYKRTGETTELVSRGPKNGNGAFDVSLRRVSPSGTRAYFETNEKLVSSDTDTAKDVYERSDTGTKLVSAGQINGNGNNESYFAAATPDGSKVFFQTDEQLTGDDTDLAADIYERAGGTTTRVTAGDINGNGNVGAFFGRVSDDGSRVFFITNESLVSGDTDGFPDIYERSSGSTKLVTTGDVNGNGGFFVAFGPISSDGSRVFFQTKEQLVAADVDATQDVYERVNGQTHLISPGGFSGDSDAEVLYASKDGSRVFFQTFEPVLRDDTDPARDVYGAYTAPGTGPPGARHPLFSRISTGQINGNTPGFGSSLVGTTPSGSTAFFSTPERLSFSDADNSNDIYVRRGGVTNLVSRGAINGNGAFTANFSGSDTQGLFIYFNTAEPLVSADTDASTDVYQGSSFGAAPKLVSTGPVNGNGPFGAAFERTAKDGLTMVFTTDEQLLASDTDSATDIYQRGLISNNTTRISAGAVNGNGGFPVRFLDASDNLARVFFETSEQLAAGDTDLSKDIYERASGTTSLVSAGEINGNKSDNAFFGGASADGLRVFFETREQLVANDTDNEFDLYERSAGTTKRVSIGNVNGNNPTGAHYDGASADGSTVFFSTQEPLTADDTDPAQDIYRRSGGATSRISAGQINGNEGKGAQFAGVSDDGLRVFFDTREKLVPADTDIVQDIYERSGGTTRRVSTGEINGNGSQSATLSRVSTDGARAFFHTLEQLVPADTDANTDVYERAGNRTNLITPGDAFASFSRSSDDGSVVFFSTTDATIASDVDGASDAYAAYLSP